MVWEAYIEDDKLRKGYFDIEEAEELGMLEIDELSYWCIALYL